ncbi:hypothetical protein TRVL_02839 [Trypanosoma vivax]|uniref:Uncharacterized protein n=1 Tax=Trypanosoma vivax (strain Y486) TaxID=1055687 RepID=G0U5R4_TRYVY|nr:hypothetical protein TRVL_02839 [Trypanosoma vivax]CCC51215.1 conserved hypothetical protein [Trypanosoma vivax Y486]
MVFDTSDGASTAGTRSACISRPLSSTMIRPDTVMSGYVPCSSRQCQSELLQSEIRETRRFSLGQPSSAIQASSPFALDDSPLQQPRRRMLGRSSIAAQHGMQSRVDFSQNDYPDPPAVGVRVPPRPSMRSAQARPVQTSLCIDEETMRRAKARCPQRAQQQMPGFIFGGSLPPERRTGRTMYAQSHKPTALW